MGISKMGVLCRPSRLADPGRAIKSEEPKDEREDRRYGPRSLEPDARQHQPSRYVSPKSDKKHRQPSVQMPMS